MKHLLFSFLLLTITNEANCQAIEVDKSVRIGWEDQFYMYTNYVNCFSISAPKYPKNTLVYKVSQGKLENWDSGIVNGSFKLSGLTNGKVTISVFQKNGTHLEFLNYKEFYVSPKPMSENEKILSKLPVKPEIDIEGYGKDYNDCMGRRVPLRIIKGAKKVNINSPYTITKMTVMIFTSKIEYPNTWQFNSGNFNDEIQRIILNYVEKGQQIEVEGIKIKDSKGNEYSLPNTYIIVTPD